MEAETTHCEQDEKLVVAVVCTGFGSTAKAVHIRRHSQPHRSFHSSKRYINWLNTFEMQINVKILRIKYNASTLHRRKNINVSPEDSIICGSSSIIIWEPFCKVNERSDYKRTNILAWD